ncbi:hypothetical protein CVV65_05580 [Kyrpidia spormannii]|uniref:Uncharacterized protein n=1 Tax=Kyrpidia spormannii TaxID=2055160 RepID=A0A2K8N5A0_9BACL|nr:hypothetical protein CVV65_05580 [Kyrpidia spormannii]
MEYGPTRREKRGLPAYRDEAGRGVQRAVGTPPSPEMVAGVMLAATSRTAATAVTVGGAQGD